MGRIDKKRDVYSKLSAMDALAKVPKDRFNSSISSVNNKTNSTDFLVDLVTALAGAKALTDYVVDTISHRLPEFEIEIKEGLKRELKEFTSCKTDPSIPIWFRNGGSGVTMKVTDVDFYDTMKTDPATFEGGLIYTDVALGPLSTDFNTYLWNTIQTPSTAVSWGASVSGVDILDTKFEPGGATTANNNVVTYTTSAAYGTQTASPKKLSEFNNDFIDTLSLFGNPKSLDSQKVMTLIMEQLFGSISSSPGNKKSKKQIENELKTEECLNCILNSEDDNISDNFFTFDNPTLAKIDRESTNRRNGIRILETCGNLAVQVTSQTVAENHNLFNTVTNKSEEVEAVKGSLDNAANVQAEQSPSETDKITIKTNFIIEIVKKLQRILMSSIITPEFMSLFAINHQIIHGQGSTYGGSIDFLKKNKKLIKNISKIVLKMLLGLLLNLALLKLTIKLKEKFADDQIEKAKNQVSIFLSLAGVPPSVIAQIRRINTQSIPNFN